MKNDGGGGGRVLVFPKWNFEIKEVFLSSHVKAEGPVTSSGMEGSELTGHSEPPSCVRGTPVKPALCHK